MFYNCPNCSQLIKDDSDTCPFCKHEISVKELREIKRDEAKKEAEFINDKIEEYSRRFKLRIVVDIIYLVLIIAMIPITLSLDLPDLWISVIYFGIILVYVILFCTLSIYRCPHCNKVIARIGNSYCRMCGGQLRY